MEKHIELNTFVKIMGLVGSGGEAKHLIRSGVITVDGEVETRNRRKLLSGMKIGYNGKSYIITDSQVR